jgi:hypothetical protein
VQADLDAMFDRADVQQDIYVDAMTQQGLNSHLAPRGRYSWQEETLVQFNRWLVKRYRDHWPANGA